MALMMEIIAVLLLLSTFAAAESVQELHGAGAELENLNMQSIQDSIPQALRASITDEEEEDEDKVVLFNGTRSAGKAQKEGMVSLKCGNLFNVNVFRELNKKLNGRVIPILCDDTMRSPLTRITEDHCRLGVLHNICEAIPQHCGETRDQVAVLGMPLPSTMTTRADTPEGVAHTIWRSFKQYMSNSEARGLSWVFKRTCMHKKGAPIMMIAIQRVELGEPDTGDLLYYSDELETGDDVHLDDSDDDLAASIFLQQDSC